MGEILVSLVKAGAVVGQIQRPLRALDGQPAITYRGKLWPLHGNVVHLDGGPIPAGDAKQSQAPTAATIADSATSETAGVVDPPPTISIGWDPSQAGVIDAPASARILVDAGPGTGKTAVACARVASLLERGAIDAVNCVILSFTHTAVREIRNRIHSYLQDSALAAGIRVVTLDAYAWSVFAGFDGAATLAGSYEDGIAAALQLVKESGEAADYFDRLQHVIIDEAQDIIGVRADFVVQFISKLPSECGVTAFSDEAQAIYGFAEEIHPGENAANALPAHLRQIQFSAARLGKIHRTASPVLQEIFGAVRGLVIAPADDPAARRAEVRAAVLRLTGEAELEARRLDISSLPEGTLVLFRRRAEALLASSLLQATPHRLRMGGLPTCLQAWIGICFWDALAPRMSQQEFEERWRQRVDGKLSDAGDVDSAWLKLIGIGGLSETQIDMKTLRKKLSRRASHSDLCAADLGRTGPILSTIHGSKGREADTVLLLLPTSRDTDTDHDEETRILFVGATRARSSLRTGEGYGIKSANLRGPRKRCYSFPAKSRKANDDQRALMTEVGRDGDVWAVGLAGREFFDQGEVRIAQRRCEEIAAAYEVAHAIRSPDAGHLYVVRDKDGSKIAVLSQAVHDDMWELGKIAGGSGGPLRPSARINHLRLLGARTIVLPPDAPEVARLHEPWASSGFMLAPVVLGYTKVRFWGNQ